MPVDYDQREKSFELFRKGKREGTWDPDNYEFKKDSDHWELFSNEEREIFLATASGFYDGEENVTRTLAPYMTALDSLDNSMMPFDIVQEEMYLSQQLYEEAKHTDFFSRYYEEVIGTQNTEKYRRDQEGYSTDDLYDMADELLAAVREDDQSEIVQKLARAYLNYMGILEGQGARAGYMVLDQICESKAREVDRETDAFLPGFQAALGKVRQDETRHIENGRWILQQFAEYDTDIVTDVYEPRLMTYIRTNILSDDTLYEEMPFSAFDGEKIERKTIQHLQDTVDYIGSNKFEKLKDVKTAIETLRTQRGGTAAADGD